MVTMPSSTQFHRFVDSGRSTAGSRRDGRWISAANNAPSDTVSCSTGLSK
ncbi:Uncharacterised protein [Mycobacteroides abscessus subsp. massiliense]|nr:Uncharacterised protein [Mycobacteroides abscessus subsp. massiliense]